jgi:hypothetical protein
MKKYGDELFIYAMAQREIREKILAAENEQSKKQDEKQGED